MKPGFRSDADHNGEAQMGCDRIWDLLSAYVDGETTADESALVESHTAQCEACASDLQFLMASSVVLHETAEVEPPAALRDAILAATVNRPTWRERVLAAARNALSPATLRYGSLAAAGAAATVAFLALRDTSLPPVDERVVYAPTTPGVTTQITPKVARPTDETPVTGIVPPAPGDKQVKVAALRRRQAVRPASERTTRKGEPAAVSTRPAPAPELTVANLEPHPFKAKVAAPSVVGPRSASEADPVIVRNEPDFEIGSGRSPETAEAAGTAPSPAPAKPTRILLAASSGAIDASQLASLADLKRELSRSQIGLDSRELKQRMRDHQIRIDVIKGSF